MATIAVVDDTPDDRELFKVFFATEHNTITFDGGAAFLAGHHPGLYDLVLLDLVMPEVDGYEVYAEIRQRGDNVPVVALSAGAYQRDRERAMEAGLTNFVAKPVVDLEQFRHYINQLLRK
jgi:CheY-like chemotaxis protein